MVLNAQAFRRESRHLPLKVLSNWELETGGLLLLSAEGLPSMNY